MYFDGPWVMIMYTLLRMVEVSVPTFVAHVGVKSGGLKRSLLEGYWKADTPNVGVYGEAQILKVAPLGSLKL
jgi:hypothetical protein